VGSDCGRAEDCNCIVLQLTCKGESDVQDLKAGVAQFGTAMVNIVETFVDADFPECLTTE
jgi:hypothetical protein